MNKETEAIFSSTGNLGVSRRQYERVYVNGTRVSDDPQEVQHNFQRLVGIGERHRQKVGRVVFRGVASQEVVEHVLNSDLQQYLETALPLAEFTDDSSSLIYMAENKPGREQIHPREYMISETTNYRESPISLQDRVKEVLAKEYTFTNTITDAQIDQVYALWSETFGWERKEVEGLQKRLKNARTQPPHLKDVWFSAIEQDETMVSLAMAERLDIPGVTGEITFVESTEWKTRDEKAGQGLMTATLAMLNAQIFSDLEGTAGNENPIPLIYAECNFQSHADRAGYGAGLRIPSREFAPQILAQNVHVNDGIPVEDGKLRDFTFMYLPKETIQKEYDPIQRAAMIEKLSL